MPRSGWYPMGDRQVLIAIAITIVIVKLFTIEEYLISVIFITSIITESIT